MTIRGRPTRDSSRLLVLVAVGGLSSVGDWLYLAVLPVLLYARTEDPLLVGVAAAARLVPYLVLSVPAGIVADRLPARRVLAATETIRLAAMLALAAMALSDADAAWIVLAGAVAAGAGTFALPAIGRLVPDLARDDLELARTNARVSVLDGLACIVGPAIAASLLLVGGFAVAFLINAATFALMLALVPVLGPARQARPADASVGEAVGDDAPVRVRDLALRIRGALARDAAVSFASSALATLTVLVAVDLVRAGEAFAGTLAVAAGGGGIVGGLLAGRMTAPSGGAMRAALLVSAAAVASLAVAGHPAASLAAMGAAFAGIVLVDTLNLTAVQRATADGTTGRALGLVHALAAGWMIAGALLPAGIAAGLGTGAAVVAVAGFVGVLGAWPAAVDDHGRAPGPRDPDRHRGAVAVGN